MRAGTWDLRVKADGVLVALHDFSMASSGGLARSPRRLYTADGDYEDAPPVSLEDLLREQARRRDG
jgi:glycerophosphoryl diester phosphodiesterase